MDYIFIISLSSNKKPVAMMATGFLLDVVYRMSL